MEKIRNQAIGVFDSGLGGLTVVKELNRYLPHEDIVYFGDTARVPYGTKSKESIIRFSIDNTKVLLKHHVKCIVVACNSSSSYALGALEQKFSLPILGVIEPGAKKAAASTRNMRIGIIATTATVKSGKYELAINKINNRIKTFSQACPLFVPIVEEGWLDKKITKDIIKEYLTPLLAKKIDTLILGCTHYPLLKAAIRKVVGKEMLLVDSAREVSCMLEGMFNAHQIEKSKFNRKRKIKFLVSDKPQEFKKIAKRFLGADIKKITKINI